MLREQILRVIDKNSRISAADLSSMLGVGESEIADCIAQMEQDNTICGYPTLIDWNKTENEPVTALIEVKVTPQRGMGFDKIAERIYRFDEVTAVYLMSGGFDLTVIIDGKSMRQVAMFVSDKLAPLDTVLSTTTHFVLKKYKDHGIVLANEVREERMAVTP